VRRLFVAFRFQTNVIILYGCHGNPFCFKNWRIRRLSIPVIVAQSLESSNWCVEGWLVRQVYFSHSPKPHSCRSGAGSIADARTLPGRDFRGVDLGSTAGLFECICYFGALYLLIGTGHELSSKSSTKRAGTPLGAGLCRYKSESDRERSGAGQGSILSWRCYSSLQRVTLGFWHRTPSSCSSVPLLGLSV
jgi:hypothetical protein